MKDLTFEVRSSHGTLTVSRINGNVIGIMKHHESSPALDDITRFDLEEWKEHHQLEELNESVDILDLGYWYQSDVLEEFTDPDHYWREMMIELMEEWDKSIFA